MADAAAGARLGACQTCNTQPARYKCPACSFPSCSLACSSAHKTATSCSGVAPPVWSRPMHANEMTWGSLMRDQSYIAGVSRAIEDVGRQLVSDKVIPQGRGTGRSIDDHEAVRLDERTDKEDRLVREAAKDGVDLVLLPKGMSKRIKNGTRWDQKFAQLAERLSRFTANLWYVQKQSARLDRRGCISPSPFDRSFLDSSTAEYHHDCASAV